MDAMCTPGGMRVAPEAQDLRQFVESVSGMDGLRVAELLRAKMVSHAHQFGTVPVGHAEMCLKAGLVVRGSPASITPVRLALLYVRERQQVGLA